MIAVGRITNRHTLTIHTAMSPADIAAHEAASHIRTNKPATIVDRALTTIAGWR